MKTTIELAREAGARAQQEQNSDVEYLFSVDQIERLLAAEREACAKVCETTAPSQINGYECAAAIRARSIK